MLFFSKYLIRSHWLLSRHIKQLTQIEIIFSTHHPLSLFHTWLLLNHTPHPALCNIFSFTNFSHLSSGLLVTLTHQDIFVS